MEKKEKKQQKHTRTSYTYARFLIRYFQNKMPQDLQAKYDLLLSEFIWSFTASDDLLIRLTHRIQKIIKKKEDENNK